MVLYYLGIGVGRWVGRGLGRGVGFNVGMGDGLIVGIGVGRGVGIGLGRCVANNSNTVNGIIKGERKPKHGNKFNENAFSHHKIII